MQLPTSIQCTLSIGVAVAMLASCNSGGSQLAPPQLTPVLAQSPASGGTFSGGYSGTYTSKRCVNGGGRGNDGHLAFNGTGKASFLRRSSESMVLTQDHQGCVAWWGFATLTRSKNPQDSIYSKVSAEGGGPCLKVSYTVTGGSGKFAKATGSGTVTIHCGRSNQYADQWSGWLDF